MERLLQDLHIRHELNAPLAPLTWYGVGGPARILAHPSSVQQLAALAARAHEEKISTYVLGNGANLLVADAGVDGLVIQLDDPGFKQYRVENSIVTVGAGFDMARLVNQTAKEGLGGLECMAGIPASVGGAVRMNAGGAYGDIGRSVRRLTVMDASGQVYHRDRDDLLFSYRKTNITARYILDAELELTPDDPDVLGKRVKEIFTYKKLTQPLADYSAGCAFKNPPPEPDGQRRSAGKLIDTAGLKGFQIGGAQVSPQHANFVVAERGASASDILAVIEHVQTVVRDTFGVPLEREVVVWP
ncbi:MAG: UDP-N-acetylmuramate dehydrogenase [Planctomycetes bacterium]|nr:UDP-N-acetylmuramate dehydrogenase [Planctomycetota bacterium]